MKSFTKILAITLAAASLSWSGAKAQLTWEKKALALTPDSKAMTASAEYPFVNKTTHPITITSVTTSCTCLKAEANAKTYAPGEKGVIKVLFNIEDRTGVHEKKVLVETDTEKGQPMELAFKATLPEILNLSATTVSWSLKEKPEKKMIKFQVNPDKHVEIVGIRSKAEQLFTAMWEKKNGANEYTITVTPTQTNQAAAAKIQIAAMSHNKLYSYEIEAKVE
jgi:hypothetical protein